MIELPNIPDAERTALVEKLVRLIEILAEKNFYIPNASRHGRTISREFTKSK